MRDRNPLLKRRKWIQSPFFFNLRCDSFTGLFRKKKKRLRYLLNYHFLSNRVEGALLLRTLTWWQVQTARTRVCVCRGQEVLKRHATHVFQEVIICHPAGVINSCRTELKTRCVEPAVIQSTDSLSSEGMFTVREWPYLLVVLCLEILDSLQYWSVWSMDLYVAMASWKYRSTYRHLVL